MLQIKRDLSGRFLKGGNLGNQFAKGNKPNKTSFKKGHKSWHTGLTKEKDERLKAMVKLKEKNPMWTGNNYTYLALHKRIVRELGKAKCCQNCSSTKNVEWANKSHEYKYEIKDWIQLCRNCHRNYDKGRNDIKRIFGDKK